MGSTTDVRALAETRALMDQLKSQDAVAERLGISRRAVRERLAAGSILNIAPLFGGHAKDKMVDQRDTPKKGVKRYILTSMQNNTAIHEQFWENLKAYAEFQKAEIMISTFTYNLNAYGELSVKRGTKKEKIRELWYDPRTLKYIVDRKVKLAPGLVWCGELNILPTKVHPISGYETYTGRKSGIIPHAKVAMESIASSKFEPTKLMYSTGAVSLKNYIQKDAGLKSEFHHTFGALLVEVDHEGDWHVRQLMADDDGNFHDLFYSISEGQVQEIKPVEGDPNIVLAINWGDIHKAKLEDWMEKLCWGKNGILDQLRPAYQFMHDLFDMDRRSHHDMRDVHEMFRKFSDGEDLVEEEIEDCAHFLAKKVYRSFCQTVVVDSNHDQALNRWLREGDYKTDPPNAVIFLKLQLAMYEAIKSGNDDFHLLEYALNEVCDTKARFLREDESFVIASEFGGGIECGNHGHLGTNGARGSVSNLVKIGRKSNYGHIHGCCIRLGAWWAGVMGALDQGYNKGPSNWSHSIIVTYRNGKRAMITIWHRKPWAGFRQ